MGVEVVECSNQVVGKTAIQFPFLSLTNKMRCKIVRSEQETEEESTRELP